LANVLSILSLFEATVADPIYSRLVAQDEF